MNIVALYKIPDDMDRAVAILSEATGKSKYEAVSRLRVARKIPVIVGGYAGSAEAEEVSKKLASAGFGTIVMDRDDMGAGDGLFAVRAFSFEGTSLRVESRQRDTVTVDYDDVDLILCGKGIRTEKVTITEKSRKLSLGRAVITSGLMMTKKEGKDREDVTENREGFIHLYGGTKAVLVFRENAVDYSSLGTLMKPSRYANFTFVAEELKRRCRNASYDESLLNKSVQKQILGPLFEPEENLDIAISLIAAMFRKGR
ncbi:MAG: hypothetical protein V3V59_01280 [Thermodesulfovibrionales bacterium]